MTRDAATVSPAPDRPARRRRGRAWLALLAAVALLAPALAMPLSATAGEAAPCCCGDAGACLCALAPGGGCGDGGCRLDDGSPLPSGDGAAGDFPGFRLDLPAWPGPLALPVRLGAVPTPAPAGPRPPCDPPETPPPRA